jgi:restriction system protein
MKLSDEVLSVPHDPKHGGQSEAGYRMAWARSWLKAARLIKSSERAVWSLTLEGMRTGKVDEGKLTREVKAEYRRIKGRERRPEARVRPIRWHDLRHTTALLLKAAGVHLVDAQRILRHSDPRITQEV